MKLKPAILLGTAHAAPKAPQLTAGVSAMGYWGSPDGSAIWDVGINSPATDQIRLSVSNNEPGAKLLIEIGRKSSTVEVPETDNHDSYKSVETGKITFSNTGQTTLRVPVTDKGTWRPTNIRSVKMLPSNH